MAERSEFTVKELAATDYLDPDGSVVQSGMNLAEAVLSALKSTSKVEVSLAGLRGASSSYFNVFLQRVVQRIGLGAIGSTVRLQFTTPMQELVYHRSLDAVRSNKPTAGTN